MKQTALVSVSLKAEVDEENANVLHVTVEGDRQKENFTPNEPRINVVLYEDNIKARSQASGGSDYTHQHVSREVNSTWGDIIEWNGDSYTYTCDLTLRDDYVRENLGVVAYVWSRDSTDPANNEVANAASITWDKVANNIAAPTVQDDATARYYTVDGREVANNGQLSGLYLVKKGNKVNKVIIK